MVTKKRHTAKFKSMVALEAAKEVKTLNELASQHSVYPAQISTWKKQLLEGAESIFTVSKKKDNGLQKKLDDQVTRENLGETPITQGVPPCIRIRRGRIS